MPDSGLGLNVARDDLIIEIGMLPVDLTCLIDRVTKVVASSLLGNPNLSMPQCYYFKTRNFCFSAP